MGSGSRIAIDAGTAPRKIERLPEKKQFLGEGINVAIEYCPTITWVRLNSPVTLKTVSFQLASPKIKKEL